MLERLVLRKDVDETLPHVVTVLEKQRSTPVAEPCQHVADLALRREFAVVRHLPAPRCSARSRDDRASCRGRRSAARPYKRAPGTRRRRPELAPRRACSWGW